MIDEATQAQIDDANVTLCDADRPRRSVYDISFNPSVGKYVSQELQEGNYRLTVELKDGRTMVQIFNYIKDKTVKFKTVVPADIPEETDLKLLVRVTNSAGVEVSGAKVWVEKGTVFSPKKEALYSSTDSLYVLDKFITDGIMDLNRDNWVYAESSDGTLKGVSRFSSLDLGDYGDVIIVNDIVLEQK